ncbi:DUF6157 family protein [Sphingomonas sp. LT1P40]|uniref:DUF6157 family protein n=1 Tax=Alteristakelama amylovorans TaxID=3096166 RepID=UPI002FCC7AE7
MNTTNYRDTLITVSPDSPVSVGTVPEKPHSVAGAQYALLLDKPYAMTSDDLLHAAHVARGGDKSRVEFFAKPQACLRASPLVKQFGWGLHQDGEARVALVAVESVDYARLVADTAVVKKPGMRRSR